MNCNTYSTIIGLSIIISLIWIVIQQSIGHMENGCQLKIPSNNDIITGLQNATKYDGGNTCATGVNCFQRCSFNLDSFERIPKLRPAPYKIENTGTFMGLAPYYITNDIPVNQMCNAEQKFYYWTRKKVIIEPSTCGQLLVTPEENTTILFKNHEYCFIDENSIFYCDNRPYAPHVTIIGVMISMPFLLVTFVIYAILPESNIHRRSLMCYVFCLFTCYMFFILLQYHDPKVPFWCHFIGYGYIFFIICSFFWMNVMCVDMWLAFSGLRGFNGSRNSERKRFYAYIAYAVGMPSLFILIILLLNNFTDVESIFNPNVGTDKCFLANGYPNLFYFYLPMAIIIVINAILFILTAVRIQKIKKETSMLKRTDSKIHSYEKEKQKFNLYVRLLFAMGINWSLEIISWFITWKFKTVPEYVWHLSDFANAAYGVFIFFIFVCKKKIWNGLKKRLYIWLGKPHLTRVFSLSRPTRSSNMSNFSTTEPVISIDPRATM